MRQGVLVGEVGCAEGGRRAEEGGQRGEVVALGGDEERVGAQGAARHLVGGLEGGVVRQEGVQGW